MPESTDSWQLDGAAMAQQLHGTAIVTLLLAFIVTAFLAIKARNRKRYGRAPRSKPPPGKFGWPIIGETLQFLGHQRSGNPREFFDTRIAKYGQVFKTSLLGHPTAVFFEPAGNRFLFANENKLVVNSWPTSVGKLFGNSLITTVGDDAKRLRRMLLTFLKPEALQKFVGKVDSITRSHMATHWIGKQQVTVLPLMKEYTFSLACSLFASVEDEDERARLSAHFNVLEKGVLQIPIDLPGTRYHKAKRAADAIRRELQIKIDGRLANGSAAVQQDLLSHLLCNVDEFGISLTHDEIKDNILVLLYAAHDTTSSTLTVLLKYLAEQPACYRDVLSEQLEIARLKQTGQLLEWEDLQKMKYSWRVAQEVLRLMPPVQGAFRKAITDFTYNGFTIPKGWKIYWTVNSTHRMSEYFSDPDKFDPSRFEGAGPAPYTFVPFGGGPRMCLGNELARVEILVFLHNLVKKFNWDLVFPNEKVPIDPVPAPLNGLLIKLHPHG